MVHGNRREECAKRQSIAMDLDRKSTTEHLVAYITTHHESLVALLPPDTTCADLFGEVENQRPIASFFSASQDAAIGRQLLRFTQMIGLWLVDEKKKTKALQQRDKRDAQETARKSILKAKRPKLDPPIVPIMAFEDAQLVAEHAQNKRDESMREALLQKGYTASLRVANQLVGVSQGYKPRMLPGLSCPLLVPFMEGGRQGYGGMLCRAATRPSTVYGGMPEELFNQTIIP
jgi:hypothetical protein